MFSLGLLIYELFGGNKMIDSVNNILNYKHSIENMHPINLDFATGEYMNGIKELLQNLLTIDPNARYSVLQFLNCPFFKEDTLLHSVQYIQESWIQKNNKEKANFLKGLYQIIPKFPHGILYKVEYFLFISFFFFFFFFF